MSDERRGVRKFLELAAIEGGSAKMGGGAKRLQLRRFFDFAVFDQTQPFAGVLITPASHKAIRLS